MPRYLSLIWQLKKSVVYSERTWATFDLKLKLIGNLSELGLLAIGGYITYINFMTIGEFMAFYYISRKLDGYISEIQNKGELYRRFQVSINKKITTSS